MEVILIEDVPHLGRTGDIVKAAAGYVRNYLLPKKLVIVASVNNQRRLEHEKRLANARRGKARAAAEKVAASLASVVITLARRVGQQDKLFGSVTVHDIADALQEHGLEVDKRKLEIAEPIKSLGTFKVTARLDADIRAEFMVTVVAQ